MEKLNWDKNDFAAIYEESGSNINKILCVNNEADAAIYTVGHPNKAFDFILSKCNTKLISLSEAEIKKIINIDPKYYFRESIERYSYKTQDSDVNTVALQIVLFASKHTDPQLINNFVNIITTHQDELIASQPSLRKSFQINTAD